MTSLPGIIKILKRPSLDIKTRIEFPAKVSAEVMLAVLAFRLHAHNSVQHSIGLSIQVSPVVLSISGFVLKLLVSWGSEKVSLHCYN